MLLQEHVEVLACCGLNTVMLELACCGGGVREREVDGGRREDADEEELSCLCVAMEKSSFTSVS